MRGQRRRRTRPQPGPHRQRSGDYRFDLLAGRIYRDLRDFTSSDTHLARAEERTAGDTDLAQVLMQRAAMLIDAGGTPKLLLGQARDLDPSLWQASYNLGVLALQEHQYPLAIMHLTEAHSYSRSPTVAAALALVQQAGVPRVSLMSQPGNTAR